MASDAVLTGQAWIANRLAPLQARLKARGARSGLDVSQADLLHAKGQLLVSQGRLEDAFHCFSYVVTAFPANARYLGSLAQVHCSLGRFEEALFAYQVLDVLEPCQPCHTLSIAQCLLHLQRPESAMRLLRVVVKFCAGDSRHAHALKRAEGLLELTRSSDVGSH